MRLTFSLSRFASVMALAASISLGGQAMAQPPMPHSGGGAMPQLTEEQKQLMMEVQQTQQQLQKTQQQLRAIQDQVYQSSPELVKQKEALQQAISKKMSSGGYDADKELKELKAMVAKYNNGQEKPTQAEIQDFQKRQQDFQMRQQQAFQDPDIRAKAEALQQNLKSKIEASGPKGKALIESLEKQIKKLESLRAKAATMMKK
ncbi:hypothetical protein AVO42_06640 [Thiomicrospira sp. XS5]|uniref:hypothetical protein n=1 Tax=Thiomicrospira sp. XS5 TaxID=1775636 RepID=UPI000746D975|nr:hypothetical protein [Thiomicrospira sp. XS5]KUJ75031.1 hypothetical protein AVO42_06640 [Thiomicrospira sp. XS5]